LYVNWQLICKKIECVSDLRLSRCPGDLCPLPFFNGYGQR